MVTVSFFIKKDTEKEKMGNFQGKYLLKSNKKPAKNIYKNVRFMYNNFIAIAKKQSG